MIILRLYLLYCLIIFSVTCLSPIKGFTAGALAASYAKVLLQKTNYILVMNALDLRDYAMNDGKVEEPPNE